MGNSSSTSSSSSTTTTLPPGYNASPESRAALNELMIAEIHKLERDNRELLEAIQVKRANLREVRQNSLKSLGETDNAVKFGLEKAQNEVKEAFFGELSQLKKSKQQILADTVAELQAVAFAERKLFMQEDVHATVRRDLENNWRRVKKQIVEEGTHKLQQALHISLEEHDRILADRKIIFDEEKRKLQALVHEHTATKSTGIFAWFSPGSSRKKPREESDSDCEDDEIDHRTSTSGNATKRSKP